PVAHQPVPDGKASRLGQLGPRSGAGADQDEVALDGAAVLGDDRLDPAAAAEARAPAGHAPPPPRTGSPSTVRPPSVTTASPRPRPRKPATRVPRTSRTPWSACRSRQTPHATAHATPASVSG